MREYWMLTKTLFFMNFRVKKGKKGNSAAQIATIAVLAVIYLAVVSGVCIFFWAAKNVIAAQNATPALLLLIFAAAGLTLILGTFSMLNMLYFCKDAQFLCSLPVSAKAIFFAKFTVVYLHELLFSVAIILIPAFALGIAVGANFLYFFGVVLSVFFVPLIPLILCALLAVPLMTLATYFKNRSVISLIFMMLAFAAVVTLYIIGIIKLQTGGRGQNSEDLVASTLNGLKDGMMGARYYLLPIFALAAFSTGAPIFGLEGGAAIGISFAVVTAFVAGLTALTVFVASSMYRRSLLMTHENRKSEVKKGENKVKSAKKALIAKEWKSLLRTPSFGFECFAPLVLTPLFSVLFRFIGAASTTSQPQIPLLTGMIMCFLMGAMFNVTSATAFSREGAGMAVLRSLPVDRRAIVDAKLFVALIISGSATLIGWIILAAAYQPFNWQVLPFLPFTLCVSYFNNALSLKSDMKHPKLDWISPVEAVKRNKNATIAMLVSVFGGMFCGTMLLSLTLFLEPIFSLGWLVSLMIWFAALGGALAGCFVARARLYKDLDIWFERMS